MSSKIRTFIAVPVPVEIREKAGGFIADLKRFNSNVKWVSWQNLHITLKFLGDIEPESIKNIVSALEEAASEFSPFGVEISGCGAFPDFKRPKVFWIGLKKGEDILRELASAIDENLSGLGFMKEKRAFSGHLTIGRVRSLTGINKAVEKMKQNSLDLQAFSVNNIQLIKSTLLPKGPVYTVLNTINL